MTLRVTVFGWDDNSRLSVVKRDAERHWLHAHAERGNDRLIMKVLRLIVVCPQLVLCIFIKYKIYCFSNFSSGICNF